MRELSIEKMEVVKGGDAGGAFMCGFGVALTLTLGVAATVGTFGLGMGVALAPLALCLTGD